MEKAQMKEQSSGIGYVFSLYAISIVCGAVLMALEIVGGRLLSPFFGSSVYVWGSIISVFLIALSTGYYYGGILSDRKPTVDSLGIVILISGLLIIVIPVLLMRMVDIAHSGGFGNYGALFVSMVLFFLPSVALGMVSPYIVKLGVQETQRVGKLVGRFYSVSTFGSIIGTFGTTFILIPLFGVRSMIYAMGLLLIVTSLLIFIGKRLLMKSLLCLGLLIACSVFTAFYSQQTAMSFEGQTVLYEKETLYNNLAVADGNDGLRYLMFNETQQSAMDQSDPNRHIWPYTYLMTATANYYRPQAKSELLIGVGGGTIPKYVFANNPSAKIDAVEIDPEVINVAKEYFFLQDNNRVHNIVDDGRIFLKGKTNAYDVIYVDAYNRFSIPFHLTTKEFYEELANAMTPDGVAVFNVVSGVEGENGVFLRSLLKTVDQVFPNRKLFFAEKRNSLNELNNIIMVVSKGKLADGDINGFKEYKGNIDTSGGKILTDDYAPVENLAVSIMTR